MRSLLSFKRLSRKRNGLEKFKLESLRIQKENGLLEHYPLYLAQEETSSPVYIFESDLHGEYYISFTPAKHRFTDQCDVCNLIYEVNFTPVSPKDPKKGKDPRIEITIFKAISIFMEEFGCPILYVCDAQDMRHACRSKLFIKWFENADPSKYRHSCVNVTSFETSLILGIIGFSSDPHFDKYFNELYSYTDSGQ